MSKRIPIDIQELRFLDIRNPEFVSVSVSEDRKKLWINVDDVCVLRIQNIKKIVIEKEYENDSR